YFLCLVRRSLRCALHKLGGRVFLKLTLHPFSSGGEVLRATDSAAHHEPCPYLMSRHYCRSACVQWHRRRLLKVQRRRSHPVIENGNRVRTSSTGLGVDVPVEGTSTHQCSNASAGLEHSSS